MDIAKVLAYPQADNQSPILTISSQVARFRIYNLLNKGTNFIPAERYISRDDDGDAGYEEAHSDLWCLDIHHDSNAPCPHNSFGFSYGSDGNSCFGTDPEVSGSIQSGVKHEFVLLAHWCEYGKNEQTEWIPISRDFFNGDEGIGDLVLALLIVRDGNQNAERISLVPIPYTDWEKASPQEMVVNFV
ncbi:hypothetical protein BKA61DRAFT_241836 [Leptodontidium sp. MPI-SDFR-AT-0119]|nr:hypothetical protein BKA61DRAFT_241836 [Leptodontidium sp. MPI-SDFR-AT-0119]